jgi:deoxyhypusine synthase
MKAHPDQKKYLHRISHRRIDPPAVTATTSLTQLLEEVCLSYNAGRLREACRLYTTKMLEADALVGLTLAGALTPAGLGMSCLVPLIEAGFIDWMVSTGANLYHDTHFALGLDLHQSRPDLNDLELRERDIIRIYDIVFTYDNLLKTDEFYRTLCASEPFQKSMGTAEFHHLVGKYLAAREDENIKKGASPKRRSVLAAAYRCAVPIFTSSPADSSIGMNLAALELDGSALRIDPLRDVNQSAALVYEAKKKGRSAVVMISGGSPKNFILQTEPQIQEVLNLPESGHDYFLQFTDARPDTGGLSGATPQEAMTWGKVDPQQLPDTVTCYVDSTIALPLLTAYALANHAPRPHRRLMDRLDALTDELKKEYQGRKKAARGRGK